jgi:hypothetical protein
MTEALEIDSKLGNAPFLLLPVYLIALEKRRFVDGLSCCEK